jgi:uncharacterized protein (TIGR02588 family)
MTSGGRGFRRERSAFEWTILGVSVAAIALIAAGLLIFSVSFDSAPPDLRVSVRPAGGADFVVTIDNQGGTTAEEVTVEVQRGTHTQEVEFKAVPKGDEEEASVALAGTGQPTATVTSYKEP